jgi:hypothetical protein
MFTFSILSTVEPFYRKDMVVFIVDLLCQKQWSDNIHHPMYSCQKFLAHFRAKYKSDRSEHVKIMKFILK